MIVFIVSFISPHTLPLGKELAKYQDVVFINTIALTEERRKLGYDIKDDNVKIYNLYSEPEVCMNLTDTAECVVFAMTFGFGILKSRLKENKLTFLMSERIFKKGIIKWFDKRTYELMLFCKCVKEKNVYLLGIGENAAMDFRILGFNKDKIFRFGYFPELEETVRRVEKKDKTCNILWVGRMVDFKRPMLAVRAIKGLSEKYRLTMIGDGVLYEKVKNYAKNNGLNIEFCGNRDHTFVINKMRVSDILLSTSHKGEGWGTVINEGMNCGCAIVCSCDIGCAGTLANHDNSIIFRGNSSLSVRNALLKAEKELLTISLNAQDTIEKHVNPAIAAKRFNKLLEVILNGENNIFDKGLCSKSFL